MYYNHILNQIIGRASEFINEEVNMLKVKTTLGNKEDYIEVLELLSKLKFETDFRLIKGMSDIQELYDEIRIVEPEQSNIKIRFLMDIADYVLHYTDVELPENFYIQKVLGDMIETHSNVSPERTTYDEFITDTVRQNRWVDILFNNPWLVAAVIINKIPSSVFINWYTQQPGKRGVDNEAQSIN